MSSYKLKYFKDTVRLNPLMFSPLDARKFTKLLRQELKRLNLLYKDYLNSTEVVLSFVEGKKHTESFIKKVRFKTVLDVIKENNIEPPFKIFVDEEPATEEDASKRWAAHCDYIVIIK